jgi:hypothetical protein
MGRLLSTAELTAVLGISRKSVYGLVRQGKLCPVEGITQGKHLFRSEDVEALVKPRGPAAHFRTLDTLLTG